MKNKLRIILLISVLTLICSCGAKKNSESMTNEEVPKELFQRWKLDNVMVNGQKAYGSKPSPFNDYEFKPNGKYLLYKENETYITGTWEYNSAEKIIYTKRENGEFNGKITDIKPQSMTLIPPEKEVKKIKGVPFSNFRFYYIPKNKYGSVASIKNKHKVLD